MVTASDRYGRFSIVIHWSTLAILVAVYACIELREMYPRGSEIREALKTWHYMLGLTVFFLVGCESRHVCSGRFHQSFQKPQGGS